MSPSECNFKSCIPITSGFPIRVVLYISCPHQSASLHKVSPSHCHLISDFPFRVPLSHHLPQQSAPFHHMCPSECPFPQF
ncbi:unnamed protein product, partial [Staurois parvus]